MNELITVLEEALEEVKKIADDKKLIEAKEFLKTLEELEMKELNKKII